MSTLGKVLAILNGVAILLFFLVTALDYGQRRAWTGAVFQQDLLINGLPLDDKEVDVEGGPVVSLIGKGILDNAFRGAGNPVKTQLEEVKDRHGKLLQKIENKQNLEAVLVPLAPTLGEREALRKQINDPKTALEDLKGPDGPFEAAFKEALTGKDVQGKPLDQKAWKQAIARVLSGTAQDPAEQQRTVVVVGLDAYAHAVDQQAASFAAMIPALQSALADDRTAWEIKHAAIMQQIIGLAERVRNLDEMLAKQQELRDKRHQALVQAREGDLTELKQSIQNTRKQLADELAKQTALETELFANEKAVTTTDSENQRLEHEIRSRETGR
jgi:predicted  nucleic acid-binding Zn-ribbon protein